MNRPSSSVRTYLVHLCYEYNYSKTVFEVRVLYFIIIVILWIKLWQIVMPKSRKNNMVVRRADDKIEQPPQCSGKKNSSVQTLYTYIHKRYTPSARRGGWRLKTGVL